MSFDVRSYSVPGALADSIIDPSKLRADMAQAEATAGADVQTTVAQAETLWQCVWPYAAALASVAVLIAGVVLCFR